MSYQTTNELNHFQFEDTYIDEIMQMNGYFYAILDNVTIMPENSCNRDIRQMRANQLTLKLPNGQIHSFLEEGYKIYDADGNLREQPEDKVIPDGDYENVLKSFSGCILYNVEQKENGYLFIIDTDEHTYQILVAADCDFEEWNRFLTKESF